jgi:hypothetical protein
MKTSKLLLIFLTCSSGSVFAQDGSPNCVLTNYDQGQKVFTVVNPAPGQLNQQCFLTVHPASSAPSGPGSEFVEGSYEILLSGGGGGGGGGGGSQGDRERAIARGGQGGAGAVPVRTVMNLSPGVYRLTMGTGGLGGGSCAMTKPAAASTVAYVEPSERGQDGNPTGIAEAYSGKTIAGFPRAELWAGTEAFDVATGRRIPAPAPSSQASDRNAPGAINGTDGGTRRDAPCEPGFAGGHGFIKMTLVAQAAPPPQAAPVIEPAPAPKPVVRPIRKDRG